MPTATGHRKLLEQLAADGITTMFGNPGSSEEGLLDEISRFPKIRYILGLQEAALVLIANGYAVTTQTPTAVQLHCSVGTGNALGSLYQAFRNQRSPLVVIAGEAGVAYDALDAHMALDLVTFARPVTKYAARAIHPNSLLRLLRRCIKMAATPPFGPTFLAVPQDILDQQNDEPVLRTVIPETRVVPEPASIARAADFAGAGGAGAAGGDSGRGPLGRDGLRDQSALDAPALPGPDLPHVRQYQPPDCGDRRCRRHRRHDPRRGALAGLRPDHAAA
jgi:thiamine pyrophosphate-dependent acetolactate synthase large subunit-like protein